MVSESLRGWVNMMCHLVERSFKVFLLLTLTQGWGGRLRDDGKTEGMMVVQEAPGCPKLVCRTKEVLWP